MNGNAPTAKMTASGVSGAMTVILIWALRQFAKLDIPPEIASAITVVFSFLAGYFAPRSAPTATITAPSSVTVTADMTEDKKKP